MSQKITRQDKIRLKYPNDVLTSLPGVTNETPEAIFENILKVDPTPTKKYLGWLMVSWSASHFLYEDIIGGVGSTVGETLSLFEKHKSQLPVQDRSLNKYSSPGDLWNAISGHIATNEFGSRELKRLHLRKARAESLSFDLMDKQGNRMDVCIPLTVFASRFWGRNTRWCTASRKYEHSFHCYAKTAPLVILMFPCGTRYQMHVDVNNKNDITIMDVADNPPEQKDLLQFMPFIDELCRFIENTHRELLKYDGCVGIKTKLLKCFEEKSPRTPGVEYEPLSSREQDFIRKLSQPEILSSEDLSVLKTMPCAKAFDRYRCLDDDDTPYLHEILTPETYASLFVYLAETRATVHDGLNLMQSSFGSLQEQFFEKRTCSSFQTSPDAIKIIYDIISTKDKDALSAGLVEIIEDVCPVSFPVEDRNSFIGYHKLCCDIISEYRGPKQLWSLAYILMAQTGAGENYSRNFSMRMAETFIKANPGNISDPQTVARAITLIGYIFTFMIYAKWDYGILDIREFRLLYQDTETRTCLNELLCNTVFGDDIRDLLKYIFNNHLQYTIVPIPNAFGVDTLQNALDDMCDRTKNLSLDSTDIMNFLAKCMQSWPIPNNVRDLFTVHLEAETAQEESQQESIDFVVWVKSLLNAERVLNKAMACFDVSPVIQLACLTSRFTPPELYSSEVANRSVTEILEPLSGMEKDFDVQELLDRIPGFFDRISRLASLIPGQPRYP